MNKNQPQESEIDKKANFHLFLMNCSIPIPAIIKTIPSLQPNTNKHKKNHAKILFLLHIK